MFCQKCGSELPNGATFCAKCGTKQDVVKTADATKTAEATKAATENVVKELKKVKPIYYVVAGAILVVLIVAICIGNAMGKTVDLNDYATVSFEGYDSRGRASFEFDQKAFEEKYGDKIKTSKDEDAFSSWFSPTDVLLESIDYELDKRDGLSNGEEVVLTWKLNGEEIKKNYGLTIKAEDKTFVVSDLKEITTFDPFTGVEVSFSGIAPNGRADLTNYPNDNGLYYDLENGYNVSNGDTVTVKVSYGWGTEESYIEEYGKLPSSESKDFTVEGLDEYVASYADIDESLINEMKTQVEDTISSYVAKSYDKTSALDSLEYVGYVFCGAKPDVDYWSSYNALFVIYRGHASNSEDKFDAVDVYFPVEFDNFLKNGEGVHYDSCDGIQGSSYFSNSWYSTKGYTNPLLAYIDLAEKNKEDYIIECGDGFEKYEEYSLVSSLADIDSDYMAELEEKATNAVLSYIEKDYSDESHVENLEVKGEYLLVAKEQGTDFAKNNKLIVVLGGYLSNDRDRFDPSDVYYPVEFDGLVSLPDKWMYTNSEGLIGYSNIGDSWYSTKGYTDGTQMFSDIVTSNRDNYKYEVSEGLKAFGE